MNFLSYFRDNFLRLPKYAQLPERVMEAIREREHANEVLARIIQIAIVLMFLFIYSISPKTSPEEAFYPVPYVLGTYLVLSLTGFAWSLRARLPDWAVYSSILFDFTLLYGLMISFHLQYMQPASFILKAPALLYVFIFIALRVLRVESKFVIVAGIVAAAGWFAMIFYVIEIDPGDNMLTRSYVEYLTSNSILIGAEVDKILSIALVTTILALAVNGSANLLVTGVTEKRAAQALSRFFDSSVADEIRNQSDELVAGSGENVDAAILNVDIRGFTNIAAKIPAPMVMEMLSQYQSRIVPIVQSNGGIIDKFMGDGILATFGTGPSNDTKNANCANAALNTIEEILVDINQWHRLSPELSTIATAGVGFGLAGGAVAHGAVGQAERLEMTVIGAAVNLSAKLEKHNKTLGTTCLVSRNVYDQAISQGYAGQLEFDFKLELIDGVEEPLEVGIARLANDYATSQNEKLGVKK